MNDETINSEIENNKIEELLEKNIEMTEEIHRMTKKIDRFVFWQKIFQTINILVIVVPIMLGIIYLPPLLKSVIGQYQELLETGESNGVSPSDLLETLK